MAQAVKRLFPDVKLAIGPAIEDGFYYDFGKAEPFTAEDLARIEAVMGEIAKADYPFERQEMGRADAVRFFRERAEPYKVEILEAIDASRVAVYGQGEFIDLGRGPQVPSTGHVKHFKLLSSSGAYWRGDERTPMLQRIYGTAWLTQEELDRHVWRLEEAKKRDHRKLGRELDLFIFNEVSPGAPFWLPHGWTLVRELERFVREALDARGYQEISTPILVNKKLWEQSGHWEHFRENMFLVESEEQIFGLKPMNCPESTLVYRNALRSYRDLPLRFSDMGRLHRNERSGTLTGLFRVRQFTQDDAHIYCRPDQLQDEIRELLELVRDWYKTFALGTFERFIGVLTEHYAGVFPTWLAPVQARVLPVSEKHAAYGRTVWEKLRAARVRAELDDRNEKLGYRIREAQIRKVPYMLVVGERESQNGTVSLRHRSGEDLGAVPLDRVLADLAREIGSRASGLTVGRT